MYTLSRIITDTGVEVISLNSKEYVHTEFDNIMADWRRQQQIVKTEERRKQMLFSFLWKVINKINAR